MNIDSVLTSLRQEQQRIAQAISALEGLASDKNHLKARQTGAKAPASVSGSAKKHRGCSAQALETLEG